MATGQYVALGQDQRLQANNILASSASGPVLKGAAQVALDGTPAMLEQFVGSGQFVAAQQDLDSVAHDATVSSYLAKAGQAAATASQNANEAQEVAANARHAADAAKGYAQQADQDSRQAGSYAQQAHTAAASAADSATRAAQSAMTARGAAASAKQSARSANLSAAWATSSANFASKLATDAYGAAHFAFQRALDAGQDADKARAAAKEAVDTAIADVKHEQEQAHGEMLMECAKYSGSIRDECVQFAQMPDADRLLTIMDRDSLCTNLKSAGPAFQQMCSADVTSPTFGTDLALSVAATALNGLSALYGSLATTEIAIVGGALCAALEPCGVLAASIIPEGTAFTSWMAIGFGDAAAYSSLTGILQDYKNVEELSGAALRDVIADVGRSVVDPKLIEQLLANGTKVSKEAVIRVGHDRNGKLVFLEVGNESSGLIHILARHGTQLAKEGIPLFELPDILMAMVTSGRVVGSRGTASIYEVTYKGRLFRLLVAVSDNGYIVTAHPLSG